MTHKFRGMFAELRKELESTYTPAALNDRIILECVIELAEKSQDQRLIDDANFAGGKIQAIKLVREAKGLDLAAGKEWVEKNTKWK